MTKDKSNFKCLNLRPESANLRSILPVSKHSQIWVETVVYTLIGLTVIAIVLVTTVPRIEKMKERSIIEQTISSLNELNKKIIETEQTPGNVRIVDFRMAKGSLEIDSTNELITYILEDAKLEMSEPGIEIKQGDIIVKTETTGSKFKITLRVQYNNIDLTYNDKQDIKVLHAGATPYRINIENTGIVRKDKTNIDIQAT